MPKSSTPTLAAYRKIEPMAVDKLLLDKENPRLVVVDKLTDQKEILKLLWTQMAVDEVALSIATNGFFAGEPLSVIPANPNAPEPERTYIVVEGNRRLAAVLLLRSESLQKEIGADLPKLSAGDREKLSELPVLKYSNRAELWQFLGFRHINGPKPWDAYAKARYVAEVYEKYGVSLKEIADSIGDRHATVVRLYRGYKILEQAEQKAGFAKEDVVRSRFYFSHLYTAADQPEFQRFLGIDPDGSPKSNPIARGKMSELKELMLWLYGSKSKGIQPLVQTQNPDLNILREVVSKPNGLAALRKGYSLERANEISIGDRRRFREAITSSKSDLQQAKATVVTGYSGESDLYETAIDIVNLAQSVESEMEDKRKKRAASRRAS